MPPPVGNCHNGSCGAWWILEGALPSWVGDFPGTQGTMLKPAVLSCGGMVGMCRLSGTLSKKASPNTNTGIVPPAWLLFLL